MIVINSGPGWFYGFNALFDVLFSLVTFFISMLSYRVYRFLKQRKYYYLFASFLLVSLAFGLMAAGAFLMQLGFYERIISILNMFDVVFLGQMALMLLAYTMLLLASMNVKSRMLIAFVMSLMVLFIVFSYQYYLKFHVVLFLLMFFLAGRFYLNYRKRRSLSSALVFVGFYFLMLSQPFFLLTAQFSTNFYIVGQLFQLLGFMSLFFMLLRVTRRR